MAPTSSSKRAGDEEQLLAEQEAKQPLLSSAGGAGEDGASRPPASAASAAPSAADACQPGGARQAGAPAPQHQQQQQQQQQQQHEECEEQQPLVQAYIQDVERPPQLAVPVAGAAATWHGMPTILGYGAPMPQPPPQYNTTAAAAAEAAAANAFLAAALGMLPHAEWERLRPTIAAWMVCSIVNFVVLTRAENGGGIFMLAVVSAMLGFMASLRFVLPSCRAGLDELTLAKQTHVFAGIAMALDLITLFLVETALMVLALSDTCPALPGGASGGPGHAADVDCASLKMAAATAAFFFAIILGVHGGLSARVARRCHGIVQLLDPVTAGRLSLN